MSPVRPAATELRSRVRDVGAYLSRRVWTAFAFWLGSAVAAALVVVWFAVGADGWRSGSDLPALVDAGLLTLGAGSAAWLALRIRRWLSGPGLSEALEESLELRAGELRGALELGDGVGPHCSPSLAEMASRRMVAALEDRSRDELVGKLGSRVRLWAKRGIVCAGFVVGLLCALTIYEPVRTAAAWAPLTNPISMLRDPELEPVTIEPGDFEVERGASLSVVVSAPGRTGALEVFWQEEGDIARSAVLIPDSDGRAEHRFSEIAAPIRYRARASDGSESESYLIVPVDPLFVNQVSIAIDYPPHTGLEAEEVAADVGELVVPAGTRFSFDGRGSRAFGRAELVDSGGSTAVELSIDGSGLSGTWRPSATGTYSWALTDESGTDAALTPPPLTITLLPDQPPQVDIPVPGRDTVVSPDLRQLLVIDAADDYGLDRLELIAYRVTALGERTEPVVTAVSAEGLRAARAQPVLDLRSWSLMPNDTVRYRARVVDRSPAAQIAESREYVLVMPGSAEIHRTAEEMIAEAGEDLGEIAEEAAAEARKNRNAARRSEADTGEFDDREALRQSLEDQERIADEIEALREDLVDLEELISETGSGDPELDAELEELQDFLRELMRSGDLQQRMDEVAETLSAEDVSSAAEELESLAEEQEALRDRLMETVERFRRAAVDQDFRATREEAAELARLQEALADAMREGDRPEARAEQQAELAGRATDLEARLERLAESLAEIEEERAGERVRGAGEALESAQERMDAAERAARKSETEEAAAQAEKAREELEELVRELSGAQEEMADMSGARVQEALTVAADDALALARRQSDLRQEMIGAGPDRIAGMRVNEAGVLEGVDNLARNLQFASQGTILPGTGVWEQLGLAIDAIRRTLVTMEVRRGGAQQPQVAAEGAVNELNQFALVAQLLAKQLGESGSSSQEMADQLEDLAQRQGEMMNQAAELMPLELGEEAMAQQMRKMAQGQEAISDDLGELADAPSASEALGDLDRLSEEAAQIAEMLARADRLTAEVSRRQERLFHRLLDAGRSLEREEYSEERESEEPEEYERGTVNPLSADQMGLARFPGPSADELSALPPALRALVLGYFERLNRGGGGEPDR